MKKDNGRVSAFILVLLSGIIFTGIACFMFIRTADFSENGEKTSAKITRIEERYNGEDTDYYVYVEFFVDGVTYGGRLGTYEIGFTEGKTVPIIYKRDNPSEFIYGKRNNFFAVLFLIAGLFLLFLTVGVYVAKFFSFIKLAAYKRSGRKVFATVTRIEVSDKSFFGRRPALASFTDEEGMIYEKNYFFGAEEFKEGDSVTIYVKSGGADDFAVENINKNE